MTMPTETTDKPLEPTGRPALCQPARTVLAAFGALCVGLGIFGLFVPGMPGTVFFLIALWAFSRSSQRLHVWLYTHPRFGAGLRNWHEYRVIPVRAKIAAVTMMTLSAGMAVVMADTWVVPALAVAVMAPIGLWISTRPATPANI